jgi:outer membrane lipoprotein-sorting protein
MMRNPQSSRSGNRAFKGGLMAAALCCLAAASLAFGQAKEDPELSKIFRQMEIAGKGFLSFSAKLTQKRYTAILKEFGPPESGELFFSRAKDGSSMIREEITKPGKTILTVKDGIATVYRPGIKEAQIINLGKHRDKAEYVAIGVGQPPSELKKTFNVTFQGTESISGALCSILSLKPRDPKVAASYSTITLWVKQSSGIPAQYKLQEPNNDYQLVTFTDEKLNSKIPDSKFEQKLPADVDKQRLQ